MTDYKVTLNDPLLPGDTLTLTVPKTDPPDPPPPSGNVVYDDPDLSEVTPDLPALPPSLHDPNKWHGLAVGVTVDGQRTVYHADHEHGQPYPDWALDLFGDMVGFTGDEISYPWQTPGENDLKHEGYKYMGWDWRPYNYQSRVSNVGVVDAAFIFTHAMGTHAAALARVHSFFSAVLLRTVNGEFGGLLYTGGHQDFGQLTVPYKGGPQSIVPLANSPQPPYADGTPPYRGHSTQSPGDQAHTHWNCVVRRDSIPSVDYHRLVRYAFRQTYIHEYVTGGIQTPDPTFAFYSGGDIFDPNTHYNSSTRNLYQVEVTIPDDLPMTNGRVDYTGFADVHGNFISASEAGPDAVPVHFASCVPGNYAINFPGPARGVFNPDNFYHGDFFFADGGTASRNPQDGRPAGWIGAKN